jgi:hypothetical protein
LPWRIEYWDTFRDVFFAEPLVSAGIVATSPISIVPIGYLIGLAITRPAL